MPADALLFVYGTLMRGYALHGGLARGARRVGEGTVRGALLDLGSYPGLVEGGGRVRGELYRLDDPELLPVLDREEGYNFQRRRAVVALQDGTRVRAWVYRYRGPRERGRPVPDGDWRRAR
ncbi:MAG TPA: gamma-glutamylcyclotransferase family protein, partial [Candidatus Tectomicrobia bacterium]|nr:gamma-glutamylcyclotransferase family protein [Candidatus Tectomicrobia bacterium]